MTNYDDDTAHELAYHIRAAIKGQNNRQVALPRGDICPAHGDKTIVMCQCLLSAVESMLIRMGSS